MANEWTKMRAGLFSYPKFLHLASNLWACPEGDQARYILGDGDGFRACHEMSHLSRCVTERAAHDVTLASLFRVWAAVNAHCKVRGMDAICEGMTLRDLDTIAGYGSFGVAMAAAGLVVECPNLLLFPNFLEHNEPACLRQPAMTAAERQRASRARKKASGGMSRIVTPVTKCHGREEKRIEEKIEEENPLTPFPENEPEKPKKKPAAELTVEALVADGLSEQTASEWLAHRHARRARLTPRAWGGFKAEAVKAGWPLEDAVVKAMARGWTGFEAAWVAATNGTGHGKPEQKTIQQLASEAMAAARKGGAS